jgi:hypothetical protein
MLSPNLHPVRVPCSDEKVNLIIDVREEKVVKEPDVIVVVDFKTLAKLQ